MRRDASGPRGSWSGLAAILAVFLLTLLPGLPALAQTEIFSDDFQRADGPVTGWTTGFGPQANIVSNQLQVTTTTTEAWTWAGNPAERTPSDVSAFVTYSFDMEFLSTGSNATVGRHGGFAFCGSIPTYRGDTVGGFNGYTVDWIDRVTDPFDHGPRFSIITAGVSTTVVHNGLGNLVNPVPDDVPYEWRVKVDDIHVRVYGDDVLYIEYEDSTYRGGHFGFWSWAGDQQIAYDNLVVEVESQAALACFDFTPPDPVAGSDIFFDAGCTMMPGAITSYDWDFGDGQTGSGATVEHIYEFDDTYTVTLIVGDNLGNTDDVSRTVVVAPSLLPFTDDFERDAGPVDGWVVTQGAWNITLDGRLNTNTSGTEPWVWAGDPPGLVSGDFVMEFDMEFLARPADTVGRHGGVMFFAETPTTRAQANGYLVDWIDRAADRGIRLVRMEAGGSVVLVPPGALGTPAEPPLRWRVEVEGPTIRVYGDNVLLVEYDEETHREGYVGFWAYSNGQDVAYDNVIIDETIEFDLTACFSTALPAPVERDEVTFDASCSKAPDGVTITAYEWNFGDGTTANGMVVDHAFSVSDTYNVTLTVRAGASSAQLSREIPVYGKALTFQDDFERMDGPVDGWTESQGTWSIASGELATGPTAAEHWIWAGDLPVITSSNVTFTCDYSFLAPGTDVVVGRHGGIQFHCDRPTIRYGANAFRGYFVDWIDRQNDGTYNDRGPRLTRCENGAFTDLGNSRMGLEADAPAEPPLEWRVEVDGDHIRVYGDDVLYIDAIDATYRGGFFGFWAWAGGQEVRIDNFNVEGVALTPCFTSTPRLPQAGKPIAFDAGCSEVFLGGQTITSYSWSFGDGSTATGATASHTYDFPDSYTVTLTVEDSGGGSESLERVITASEDLIPLADCFERPAGDVDGWTVQQGIWSITDEGKLATNTADAVEHWLWAGDPPAVMAGDFVLEYDLEFFAEPADGVGRHGGVMFFAQAPTTRGVTSGYTVWWIDRVDDFGIVLARRDNGALTQLQAGTGDAILDPPLTWRIEVEGPTIRILGDGVEYVSVEDDTYREGYFGLWQYSNGQDVLYDNIRMGVTTLPECGEEPVTRFVRGDPDSSGVINITDGIRILSYLFTGGAALECDDAGDTDDDGLLTITDAIKVFGYLFLGQGEPAAPAPSDATYLPADCAADPTPGDPLDCGKMSDTCK